MSSKKVNSLQALDEYMCPNIPTSKVQINESWIE